MRQTILVRGYNYRQCPKKGKTLDSTDFMVFVNARRAFLAKTDPDMRFTLFDFGRGAIRQATGSSDPWGADVNTDQKSAVGCADYVERELKKNPTDKLSIKSLYTWIEKLGRTKASMGTVFELSVFSHATYEGPVLLNTYEHPRFGPGRDPDDNDGRYQWDFRPPHMTDQGRSDRHPFAQSAGQ